MIVTAGLDLESHTDPIGKVEALHRIIQCIHVGSNVVLEHQFHHFVVAGGEPRVGEHLEMTMQPIGQV